MTSTTKIDGTKCCNFSNSFSTTKCFVLFELIFILRFDSLLSKSVFVTKFACVNLAAKVTAVSLLNSGVVICLSCYDK